MPPPESSDLGRPQPRLSSTIIPDLTDKIIRPNDQYSEAGGFGDVFRCRYTSDDGVQEVAVKAFRFSFTIDEHKRDVENLKGARMIRRELGIWRRLSHRNVVPFLGIAYGFGRQGSASLVSMWMPHGTLHMFLKAHDSQLAVAHRLQLLLDISNGLQYLHSFPLVHGDLSSNNVLLDHNYSACLTDFGCASLVGELPEGFTYLKMSTVGPGTLRWAAPEHFSLNEGETKHTTKSDIYSFGNMALLVLSGEYPWSEVRVDAAVVLRLSQGHKPGRPLARPIDDRHWALIEQCWSLVPERPLAEDVVSSLRQLLDAYLPPPLLRDLLDAPTPSSNVPDCPSNDDDPADDVTPIETSLERLRSLTIHSSDSDSKKQAEHVRAGYFHIDRAGGGSSYSNPSGPDSRERPAAPSTMPKLGLGAEDTVSQEEPTTGKRVHHLPSASPWASTSSVFQIQLHPFLNGETPYMNLYFDMALSSFTPLRRVGPGQTAVVSPDELDQPATYPPVARMRISYDAIPQWPIDLEFHYDTYNTPAVPLPIKLGDVLYMIHSTLHTQITYQDWARLSLSEETAIARAFTRRYKRVSSSAQVEASQGVKRIDYLLNKHVFRGLIRTHAEDGLYHWRLITE